MPFESYTQSASVLDRRRLNKQVLECRQIVNVLYKKANDIPVKGWANHPAVTMWEGYEWALFRYATAIVETWGTSHKAYENMTSEHSQWCSTRNPTAYPPWLGREAIHSSHRSRLLHKGVLDELRRFGPHKGWFKLFAGKELRDFSGQNSKDACIALQVGYDSLYSESHYFKFNWAEEPDDEYIWANTEI